MIYYYEFSDEDYKALNLAGPVIASPNNKTLGLKYASRAHRIWLETGTGHVIFIKNRHYDLIMNEENLKEFFWIKLRAHNV
jgi:hypothetical protein